MADVVAPAPVGDGAMRTELQELQMQANVITDEVSVCGLCFFVVFLLFFGVCVCVCMLVLFYFLNEHLWFNVCCTVFVCEYPVCIVC